MCTLISQTEAVHFEEAIKLFNDREVSLGDVPILRHKVRRIRLISKEKYFAWDEKSSLNFYDITFSYPDSESLLMLGQDFGQRKVFAIQQGTYGREAPG